MATSVHSTYFFNDGDPVDPADFNEMQVLQHIEEMDRMMGLLNGTSGPEDPEVELGLNSRTCYVPRVAGAMPFNGNGLDIGIQRGWIYAKNPLSGGSPNGTVPTILAHYVTLDNAIGVLAAADPTNPRIDLLQVSLSHVVDTPSTKDFEDGVTRELTDSPSVNRRRRTVATWSIKQGTPAANPTRPLPDAGYVAVACVRLLAGAVSYGVEDLWDMRMPMRLECQRVQPAQMAGGDTWVQGTDDDHPPPRVKTANDDKALWAFPHTGQMGGRIIGCGAAYILTDGGGNAAADLRRLDGENNPTTQQIVDLFSDWGTSTNTRERAQIAHEFAQTTGGGMGSRPIWTNFYGPPEAWAANFGYPQASSEWNRVGMRFQGSALSEVFEAWFFVAVDL